ncbi:MAG: Rubredoxin-type Fe(Cys)4 protein [Vampirovibrio sp.]|jgi:rubredoxin|nr:Rubredoxin-type Fe(Cys)4 protein [Vampirovibrio sp.]
MVYNHWAASQCYVCETIYDPMLGDTARGVPPETQLEKLPDDWRCECGASKRMYLPKHPE